MYVKTDHDIPLGHPLDVTVYPTSKTSFTLQASAVRQEDAGLGMQILGMDVLSFVFLRNTVTQQCNDHDKVMRETFKVIRYIH